MHLDTRKVSVLTLLLGLFFWLLTYQITPTEAATQNSNITANMDVNATISNSCTATLTMNAITGTGQSSLADNNNRATCTVITNNSAGYKLEWSSGTAAMTNANSDTIAAYTPGTADTPEQWSVAAAASEWGGHLGSASTSVDTGTWGTTDAYLSTAKWVNVKTSAFQIASRDTETTSSGDTEYVWFTAEVGASKFQPTGTYTATVTMTATTL